MFTSIVFSFHFVALRFESFREELNRLNIPHIDEFLILQLEIVIAGLKNLLFTSLSQTHYLIQTLIQVTK